jgi:alpha-beta hydrolase superfamily lysophospholipase
MLRVIRVPERVWRWTRTHRRLTLCLAALLALLALNVVAFNQAWSMTHFSASGSRTASPEALSFLEKVRVGVMGVSLPKPINVIDPSHVGLGFETVRFGGATGSELEGWFIAQEQPKGCVLFAHGYGACKASLLHEARAINRLGYSALLVDFHGSGGSEGRVTSLGVREADDVADAVMFVKRKSPTSPLILYGQSMGSAAILRAITVHGIEPAAVIVECPFDRLLSTAENRFRAMRLPPFPGARLLIFWGGVQLGFNGFQHNPADYARQVGCPVLFLHGAKDPRVTLEQAQAVFDNLAGEKSFVLFPTAGHESLLASDPDLWTRSVSHFLKNRRGASAP